MQTNHARFAGLLSTVLVGGLGLIALHAGTKQAFHAAYALTVAVLLASSAAAWSCRRDAGVFWFGFATTGWVLLWLGFGQWLSVPPTGEETCNSLVNECLLTARLLKDLDNALVAGDDVSRIAKYGYNLAVGHLLLTCVFAFAGGSFALALRGTVLRRTLAQHGVNRASAPRRPYRSAALAGASTVFVLLALIGAFLLLHDSQEPYFPTPASGLYPPQAENLRKHLAAIHEPSLWKLAQADPAAVAYRLLWFSQASHPTAVRVVKRGETAQLYASVLDDPGDDDPGTLAVRRGVLLDRARWTALAARADESGFWSLPTQADETEPTSGDSLIIEGVANGRHHVVVRSRGNAPKYDAFSEALLDASGLGYQPAWGGFR